MLKIIEVPLSISLPVANIGMVAMQPYFEFQKNSDRYCWKDDKKSEQIDHLIKTIEIAKITRHHNCEKTHFTLFPEYSIPGLDGINRLQGALNDSTWPCGTLVIGGVDGLSKAEYGLLCSENMTQVHEENKAEKVSNTEWVNCCVIWEKASDGSIKKWIQPKLVASFPEMQGACTNMFCGKSVYIFKGKFDNNTDCYFLPLICFDWIGQINSISGIKAVLSAINAEWERTGRKEINFIFVIQNNEKPNYQDFLGNAKDYFEDAASYSSIGRDNSVIMFANTAGGILPGKYNTYGCSSLICSPNAPYEIRSCPPTFAIKTRNIRNVNGLGRCKDAIFRENGACVYSFGFSAPSFVNRGVSGRRLIVSKATMHPIDGPSDDPRLPGDMVAASVKWINDQVDSISPLLQHRSSSPIRNDIKNSHDELSEEVRKKSDEILRKNIEKTICNYDLWIDRDNGIHDVDSWNDNVRKGLETIMHSCSTIKACKELEIFTPTSHAVLKIGSNVIDIIIVSGGENPEKCAKYGRDFLKGGARYSIIITRDIADSSYLPETVSSILEITEKITERGPRITDPSYRCIAYHDLQQCCFDAQNIAELDTKITELIA